MLAVAIAGWFVFLPVSGAPAVGGNLAPNPGFEAAGDDGTPAQWRRRDDAAPVTFARDTRERHGGAASARITTEPPELPAWPSYSTELGSVEEGQVYRAEAFVKTRDVSQDAGIGLSFLRDDGTRIAIVGSELLRGTVGWTKVAVKTTVPPETSTLVLGLVLHGTGTAWFDDVSLVRDRGAEKSPAAPGPANAAIAVETGPRGRVAILRDVPGTDAAVLEKTVSALRSGGFGVTSVTCDELASPSALTAANFDFLLLPDGRYFPASAKRNLTRFLKGGGHLVTFGGRAFEHMLFKVHEQWTTTDGSAAALKASKPGAVGFNSESGDHAAGINLNMFNTFAEKDLYDLAGTTVVQRAAAAPLAVQASIRGPFAGTSAVGFAMPSESRFFPLLEARDRFGRNRGWAAGLIVNYAGAYRGSAWLFFGITDRVFYTDPAFQRTLLAAVQAMKSGRLCADAKRENDEARKRELKLAAPVADGFVRVGPDGHFVLPTGKRFFMVGCNCVGSFDTWCRFADDDYFDVQKIEDTFRMASAAGVNVMRYWQYWGMENDIRRGDRRKLDAIFECARRYKIYLLIETNAGLGSQREAFVSMADKCAMLRKVAAACKDEPMVLGYDLRNEPSIATVASPRYPESETPPLQTTDFAQRYAGDVDANELSTKLKNRTWPAPPATLQGDAAKNATAAALLWWHHYGKKYNLTGTLAGLSGDALPADPKWDPLVKATDESFALWIRMQREAIREVDPRHLITVGYDTPYSCLRANKQLDFISQHVYARPFGYDAVMDNVTTPERLAKVWPGKPVTIGEFGYSTGLMMPDKRYLDRYTASVGEMAHYLVAFAHGYDGCMKWVLVDRWSPFAGTDSPKIEGKLYEARFGMYGYDGTATGRPKPICPAMKFFSDYAGRTGPSGTLAVTPGPTAIGAVYEYRNRDALFVGNLSYKSDRFEFTAAQPANVMLAWDAKELKLMSTADAQVKINPAAFGPLGNGVSVSGKYGGLKRDGAWLVIDVLEGETLIFARQR
jgi:hypothetical protein